MAKPKAKDGYYAGITNLVLLPQWKQFDLGEGLVIHRTFGHFMQSNIMAFEPPEKPGKHHAGPWKTTSHHEGWDIFAELFIPSSYKPKHGLTNQEVARTLVIMMRLVCDPTIRFLIESNHSLSAGADLPDSQLRIEPVETIPQYIRLGFANEVDATESAKRLAWVRENWKRAVQLMGTHAEFRLAMDAFATATFVPNHALTLVSLWGALEALFSPSTSELRFRVSVLVASYLHRPGQERAVTQKELLELYDKRSAAAHGKPKHTIDHLVRTFNIVKSVLTRMIEEHKVPSKEELNDMLLGVVNP